MADPRVPEPSVEILEGRRALEGVRSLELVEDLRWYESSAEWALHLRLRIKSISPDLVPPVSAWYLLIPSTYPLGEIRLFPANEGGITETFPHQMFNGEAWSNEPWRRGHLCLTPQLARVQRLGTSDQPRAASHRLRWHVERALWWLDRASRDELLAPGDPFELPAYPPDSKCILAFSESPASLMIWNNCQETSGYVELQSLLGNPEVSPPRQTVALSFRNRKGEEIFRPPWGRQISIYGQAAPMGIWIRLPRPPVLKPWQAPRNWRELREECERQGVALWTVLHSLAPRLRDHGLALKDRPHRTLLLGFPIPQKIQEPPNRIHWLGIDLPPFSAGMDFAKGHRENERGYQQRDRQVAGPDRKVSWISSECWNPTEFGARGILSPALRSRRVLLIGAGALGSALAEMMVRGGVHSWVVMDGDSLQAGNLVRHTLSLRELGQGKATALADRLNEISPFSSARPISSSFQDAHGDDRLAWEATDLVLDCTASDELALYLEQYPWPRPRIFVSCSLGFEAKQLFFFAASSSTFPAECLFQAVAPWVGRNRDEMRDQEFPWEGIGCWHPVFPARVDHIWQMAAVAVQRLETFLESGTSEPCFEVFGRLPDGGVQRMTSGPSGSAP